MQAAADRIVADVHAWLPAEPSSLTFQNHMVTLLDAVQYPEYFRRMPWSTPVAEVAQMDVLTANLHEQGLGEPYGQYMMMYDPVHGRRRPGRGDAGVYPEVASSTGLPEQFGKVARGKSGVDNDGVPGKPFEKLPVQSLKRKLHGTILFLPSAAVIWCCLYYRAGWMG